MCFCSCAPIPITTPSMHIRNSRIGFISISIHSLNYLCYRYFVCIFHFHSVKILFGSQIGVLWLLLLVLSMLTVSNSFESMSIFRWQCIRRAPCVHFGIWIHGQEWPFIQVIDVVLCVSEKFVNFWLWCDVTWQDVMWCEWLIQGRVVLGPTQCHWCIKGIAEYFANSWNSIEIVINGWFLLFRPNDVRTLELFFFLADFFLIKMSARPIRISS